MLIKRFLLLCFLALSAQTAFAAPNEKFGEISGRVVDSKSKNSIELASVILVGTEYGATTDGDGRFNIKKVPAGSYIAQIQFVGYNVQKQRVEVFENSVAELNVKLSGISVMSKKMVVTGTRTEKFKRDVPVIVNVVDAEMIENTQSLNLLEGLSYQPGVRIENNCQNCGFSQVRMNGLEGKYSQVLVNSRPVFSALAGVYGLEHFPSIMIDRVEIMRGGGSSVFGSNAIAGTINIITKQPVENAFEFSTNTAFIDGEIPDNQVNMASSMVSDNRNAGMFLFGNYRYRSPYDANDDGFSELSKLQDLSAGMQGFYTFNPRSKLSSEFHVSYEDRRGGNAFEKFMHQADVAEGTTHISLNAGLNYDYFLSDDYKQKLNFYTSVRETDRDSYYGGLDPDAYGTSEDITTMTGVQYNTVKEDFAGNHEFVIGAEFKYSELEDSQPAIERSIFQVIRNPAFFIQDDWDINKSICLLIGLRIDDHNLVDDLILNPRVSALVNITPELQARAGVATGFRAPQTFDEDLHILSAESVKWVHTNSENLKEERSLSFSGSFDYTVRDIGSEWGITLEGFYTKLFDPFFSKLDEKNSTDDFQIYERINTVNAKVIGSTVEGRYLTPYMQIQIGATIQSSKYDEVINIVDGIATDEFLRNPSLYGYFTTNFELTSQLSFNLSGVYTGSMDVYHEASYIEKDVLVETDPFFELNTKVSYMFPASINGDDAGLTVSLGVQNMFNSYQDDFDKTSNRDPAYIYGPTRPRTFFVGTKLHF